MCGGALVQPGLQGRESDHGDLPAFNVDALKKSAKAMFSEDLTHVSSSDLIVTTCEGGKALSAGESVADLGKNETHQLFVHIPEQKLG